MLRFLKKLYVNAILLFLYAPIFILMIFSFNASKSRGTWGGFSLKWYEELFKSGDIMQALYYTIIVAILSTIISTALGTFAAIGISEKRGIWKKVLLNLNYLPVVNPDIVTAVSLMALYSMMRLKLGFITILLSHIVFSTPYVVLSVLPKLKSLDPNLAEAALDLGATPFYALRKVIIPEIMPGIITGALLSFTLSIDDFVISFFNTGNGVTNLSIEIFAMARRGVKPTINALSTLMFLTMMVLLIIIYKRDEGGKKLENE
ncbi:MAG: ABC transporter permease [Tissierellia bacterium]|nr:ABC transporter permease [Tissierellia bacterium]